MDTLPDQALAIDPSCDWRAKAAWIHFDDERARLPVRCDWRAKAAWIHSTAISKKDMAGCDWRAKAAWIHFYFRGQRDHQVVIGGQRPLGYTNRNIWGGKFKVVIGGQRPLGYTSSGQRIS